LSSLCDFALIGTTCLVMTRVFIQVSYPQLSYILLYVLHNRYPVSIALATYPLLSEFFVSFLVFSFRFNFVLRCYSLLTMSWPPSSSTTVSHSQQYLNHCFYSTASPMSGVRGNAIVPISQRHASVSTPYLLLNGLG
jgi:hypothetical protein